MTDVRAAITKLLMGKPGGPWEGGIRAYHSSPYDFDKFDWSKLRTGEGANIYGAGFYAAENPAVSGQGGQYWKQFLTRTPTQEIDTAELLKRHGFDREKAIAEIQNHNDLLRQSQSPTSRLIGTGGSVDRTIAKNQAEMDLLRSGAPVGPRTYEVNINARPELMLDWDKPLSQNPAAVKDAFIRMGYDPNALGGNTGAEAYRALSHRAVSRLDPWERGPSSTNPVAASEMLRDAGIPGIRYLDQGSRNAVPVLKTTPHGDVISGQYQPLTYNYVVTDPSKLDILAKYSVAGGAAVPVMSGAFDQSRYEAQ